MIGNALLALAQWAIAGDLPSGMASLAVIGGVLNVAGLIFAIGVWNWKKWGVYGYVGGIGLSMLLSLAMGQIPAVVQGILPMVLLIGLTRPIWKQLKFRANFGEVSRIMPECASEARFCRYFADQRWTKRVINGNDFNASHLVPTISCRYCMNDHNILGLEIQKSTSRFTRNLSFK